jgi:hypothetical protein
MPCALYTIFKTKPPTLERLMLSRRRFVGLREPLAQRKPPRCHLFQQKLNRFDKLTGYTAPREFGPRNVSASANRRVVGTLMTRPNVLAREW